MSLREEIYNNIKERRQRLIDGKVNSIPSPFVRFSDDFIGLEQGIFMVITAMTKGGKSQLTSYLLFEAIMFLYESRKAGRDIDLDIKILWFPLEETQDVVVLRFMSWLINRLSGYRMRYSPRDLMSSKNSNILPQEVLDFIAQPSFIDIIDFFNDHVIFSEESNPTGIWKTVKQYCEDNGTVIRKTVKKKDDSGIEHDVQIFDRYVPNKPNEYVFAVVDTVNILDLERNFNKKQTIDKMSEYCIKLRNRYNVSPILVQQQNADNEAVESIKLNRTRPTTAGLGDSKYTSHDANIVLGLFSPFRFGLKEYLGYSIDRFKDHFRTLEVLVNRNGLVGGIVPLFFDGAVCNWEELPQVKDVANIRKVYDYMQKIDANPTQPYGEASGVFLSMFGGYKNAHRSLLSKVVSSLHSSI